MAGNTPLSGAVAMAKVDAVKVLLENGADPDEATSKGFTPVMIAVLANRPAILKILLNAGADINKPHPKGWTVFQLDRSSMAPEIRSALSRLAPEKPKKKKQRTSFPGVDIIR
jgi:ankyrin repeat protein